MRNFGLICIILLALSCKNSNVENHSILDNKTEWEAFVNSLNKKVGTKGGYANINYREKSNETEFLIDITTDTNSVNWTQYSYNGGNFNFKKVFTINVIGEAKPTNFVYKPYQYDLKKVNKLVNDAKSKLLKEKNVKDVRAVLYGLNSPNFTDNDFNKEFNNVIWIKDLKTETYYTFRYNAADSCEMFSELPKGFKF